MTEPRASDRNLAMSACAWSLRIGQGVWEAMAGHINRGDHDEHGAP